MVFAHAYFYEDQVFPVLHDEIDFPAAAAKIALYPVQSLLLQMTAGKLFGLGAECLRGKRWAWRHLFGLVSQAGETGSGTWDPVSPAAGIRPEERPASIGERDSGNPG